MTQRGMINQAQLSWATLSFVKTCITTVLSVYITVLTFRHFCDTVVLFGIILDKDERNDRVALLQLTNKFVCALQRYDWQTRHTCLSCGNAMQFSMHTMLDTRGWDETNEIRDRCNWSQRSTTISFWFTKVVYRSYSQLQSSRHHWTC